MIFTIIYVRRLRDLTESVRSKLVHLEYLMYDVTLRFSVNWLSRTAVNVGIGPTAKKAIREYALRQSELAKFVHTPAKE